MKKGLALLTCSFMALPILANNNLNLVRPQMSLKQNATQNIEWPAQGTQDASTPFEARWHAAQYGFKRIGDTSVAITGLSGWGFRCDYGPNTFTRDEFEISLDLSEIPAGDVVTVLLGSDYCTYMTEGQAQLCMEILKSPISETPHDYLITLNRSGSKNEGHNETTLPEWINNEQSPWLDSYTGAIITAENDNLTLGFNNVTETTADFYVNDYKKSLEVSKVFETLGKEFYLTLGTGVGAGERHFIVNHIYGFGDKTYYGNDGKYQKVKAEVQKFIKKAQETKIDTIDDFVTIYSEGNGISFEGLKAHDVVYLKQDLDSSINSLKEVAISKFGNDAFLSLYGVTLDTLESLQANFNNKDTLNEAIAKCKELEQLKNAIDGLTLTEEQSTKITTLVERYTTILAKVNKSCGDFYTNSITNAIKLMDEANNIGDANEAEKAFINIDSQYASYVDENLKKELEEKLNVSRTNFINKYTLSKEEAVSLGLSVPTDTTYVLKTDKGISYSAYGGTSTGSEEGNGLLFTKEAIDVADFSLTYDIKQFSQYAISIMDKPSFWSNADDPSIQNHKGLVFLVRNKNETTASVETYLIDGTANRFFDGQVSLNSFDIPKTGEIKLSFKIKTIEQSGIYDNYFEYDFNGKKYESPIIKAFSLLGAFENGKGYLGIGSQGGTNSERLAMDILDINGNNPATSSTISKKVDYSPIILNNQYTFELESTKNLIVPVNPMLKSITKIMIDSNVLTKDDYSYTRNSTLTLKAKTLNKLAAGEHVLSVTTSGGTAKIKLIINSKNNPDITDPDNPETPENPDDENNNTNVGMIVGIVIGAIAAVALLGGVTTYFVKKKKQNK